MLTKCVAQRNMHLLYPFRGKEKIILEVSESMYPFVQKYFEKGFMAGAVKG